MGTRIREMRASDLEAVGNLAGKLVRMHYAFDPQRFLKPVNPERGYAGWFKTQLDKEDVFLLVAEDEEGMVVGYVYAALEPRSYNDLLDAHTKLHDIYIDERARRQGVAQNLLTEVLRRAKEKGAPRIVLSTATQNEEAQHLFEKMGFRPTMIEMTREL